VRGGYVGARGCRISLHIITGNAPHQLKESAGEKFKLAHWVHDKTTYYLIATAMSPERFSALERYVAAATRPAAPETDDLRVAVQRTWQATTPCQG
jgi:hypothetical protein